MNVYAPCDVKENNTFFENLTDLIPKFPNSTPLIIGDTNVALHPIDSLSGSTRNHKGIKKLMRTHNLLDAYREMNPNKIEYTWHRHPKNLPEQASRIDLALIPSTVHPQKCKIQPLGIDSDHIPLFLKTELEIKNISSLEMKRNHFPMG
jgi:exonuclease III